MRKFILLFIGILVYQSANTQSLDTFTSRKWAVEFAHQNITRFYWDQPNRNNEPPKDRISGGDVQSGILFNSFYVNYKNASTQNGAQFIEYTNVKMGDWVSLLYRIFFLNESKRDIMLYEKKILTSGYLGELNCGRNIFVSNKKQTIISGGLNIADMILPSDYFGLGGYHINTGIFINAEQLINENWSTSFIGSYSTSIAYLNGSMSDYVNPKSMRFGLNLNNVNGIYCGWEFRRVDTNAQRVSLKLGYRFSGKTVKTVNA